MHYVSKCCITTDVQRRPPDFPTRRIFFYHLLFIHRHTHTLYVSVSQTQLYYVHLLKNSYCCSDLYTSYFFLVDTTSINNFISTLLTTHWTFLAQHQNKKFCSQDTQMQVTMQDRPEGGRGRKMLSLVQV